MVWQRYFDLIPEKVPLKQCDELERTAFHESGHAVVACYFGFTLQKATIIKEGGTLGSVSNAQSNIDLYDQYPDEFEKTYWAGVLAEYLFGGNWNEEGASSDRDEMNHYFYFPIDDSEADEHFDKIFIETYNLLKTPEVWNMVELFAKELMIKKILAQEDFDRLFPDFEIPSLEFFTNKKPIHWNL